MQAYNFNASQYTKDVKIHITA